MLRIPESDIAEVITLREALDARKKGRPCHVYTLAVRLKDGTIPKGFTPYAFPKIDMDSGLYRPNERPIIVGFGPAGLFCAKVLIQKGYRPIILEQGKTVAGRLADVQAIAESGRLDECSNVLFGEGGAGAFSDGKLTARNPSPETDYFYRTLIEAGADPRIGYQAKPHLGSDPLRRIIPAMTGHLLRDGAEVYFGTQVQRLAHGQSGRIIVSTNTGEFVSDCVILAVGHSADSLYRSLLDGGVTLVKKTFAAGVRIEHPREFIDEWQYGKGSDLALTGPADYRLAHVVEEGRGVYSFCVCPGGEIINASSGPGRVGVNGMSWSQRDGRWTNGAIVVTVLPSDLPDHPLAGVEFRKRLEEACHVAGPLFAPAQPVADFLAGRKTKGRQTTYRPGTFDADISGLMPPFIVESLRAGFNKFDRQIRGFVQNGVLVAPETGTSSPVRMLRDRETFESVSFPGLFPIGEGAGYAGGIVSSAADGIRLALRFKSK
ncbi:MAG: hypothetical protein V1913_08520 [Fibrobacterota bacterium]